MSLLEAIQLGKSFTRRTAQGETSFNAVAGINLAVEAGDFVTITGTSGSGKTTLLTMLAGLTTPGTGAVLLNGKDMYTLPDEALSRLRNREISFIPQGMGLLGNLTVFDNVRAPQLFGDADGTDSDRAGFLLEAVGLKDLAWEYPRHLSGGEIRRVAIARALFNEPAVLIADEPTSDLDPDNTRAIMDLLTRINRQGTALIVVTHEQDVANYGTVRFSMKDGVLSPSVMEPGLAGMQTWRNKP